MMRKAALLACAGLAALLLFADLAEANEFEEQVNAQLDAVAKRLLGEGARRSHEPYIDAIDNRKSDTITIELDAGDSYALVGVCDVDCSDMDMFLYDAYGNELDRDVEDDDVPVVTLDTKYTGKYTIRVEMIACSENPCYYGIGTFAF